MARTFRGPEGVTVRLSGLEGLEAKARGVGKVIDGTTYLWLSERVREAQAQWPVDTGKSRRGLQAIRGRGGGRVVGRVSYTRHVHRAGETQRSWEVLIRQPILVRRKELMALLRRAVVRHMEGRHDR